MKKVFVSNKLETFLEKNGWEKISDYAPEKVKSPYLGEYWRGFQCWRYHAWELLIDYDENGNHKCELWWGNSIKPESVFLLRNIKKPIRRRGLAN